MADQKFNVNCGFFDSVNQDRLYSADQMNRPYKRLISNGVFATQQGTASTDLKVQSANNGMNIIVKAGEGIFADKWFDNPSDITIEVPNNTNIVPRRDSVIVQVDKTTSGRTGNIVYRTGTPNTNPQPPAIGTVTNVIEYRIANIYVAPSATYIGNDAIVDLRGSSECQWITSLIKQVDTSVLYDQYRAAYDFYYQQETDRFNDFMQSLTEELTVSTNVVKLESHYESTEDETTIVPINIADYDKTKDVLIVRVNRLFASEGIDYTISQDGKSITLTKDIFANNTVDFLVLKSIIIGDNETVVELIQALSNAVSTLNANVGALNSDSGWINFSLESGAVAYSTSLKPAIRKFGNKVNIRGAIKGFNTVNSTICTLPVAMRPTMNHYFTSSCVGSSSISGTCVFEVSTTGSVKIIAKTGTINTADMLPMDTNFIVG